MKYKRLIPSLILKNGLLVRSQLFKYHQAIGDPIPTIKRLSDWSVDEIVLINISNTSKLDSRRDDKWHNIGNANLTNLVKTASAYCFAPLTIGGGIRSIAQMDELFKCGADKCMLNTALFEDKDLIGEAIKKFGSQAVVASLDFKLNTGNIFSCFIKNGTKDTEMDLISTLEYCYELGVGEILISSIDFDGSGKGYDPRILNFLPKQSKVPIIINSGATKTDHFVSALNHSGISAVSASNIFYFTELSYPKLKNHIFLKNKEIPIRSFNLESSVIKRDLTYNQEKKKELLKKYEKNEFFLKENYNGNRQVKPQYCTRCLYSSQSATPMQFDDKGLCMGCRVSDAKLELKEQDYSSRKDLLLKLVSKYKKSNNNYDCIVSVSGGKDSYYQTHYVINELKLNPLLVTYNGNNYTEVGWKNLLNMRNSFGCDHIIISPSIKILKKLNRLAFIAMGDMNWHAHVGIFTTAPRVAVQQNIPLIFWGEHGYADLCGQFSMQDFPEMNFRERTEHAGRGYDWEFFIGMENIQSNQMNPWKYPSDQSLLDLDLRQIYLGHYIPWESNNHLELVIQKYNFHVSKEPFQRTYRTGSNLDDMHENGVHDYLKYIKFGYGRCTDHASKDIRAGLMSRDEGILRASKMDPIKSNDLKRWLEYVDIDEVDFDRIADHFRDPRVWRWDEDSGWSKLSR